MVIRQAVGESRRCVDENVPTMAEDNETGIGCTVPQNPDVSVGPTGL